MNFKSQNSQEIFLKVNESQLDREENIRLLIESLYVSIDSEKMIEIIEPVLKATESESRMMQAKYLGIIL